MSATIILREEEFKIKPGQTVRSALEKLGIPNEAVLATREGELLTDEEIVEWGDVIKLIAVISGG